jgi:hypothetical protein
MATRIIKELIDDLDGTPASATIPFSFNGTDYEIDLSGNNLELFQTQMEPYTDAARKLGRSGGKTVTVHASSRQIIDGSAEGHETLTSKLKATADRNKQIREWAREHGYEVAERGALRESVVREYERHLVSGSKRQRSQETTVPQQPNGQHPSGHADAPVSPAPKAQFSNLATT